ncbi:unnamed protein product [Linum trigynum]|uniref:Uncharacterized protein n=1 Tax=Linum trigynum TaxID=586398 RepID=A0AAV2CNQ8_9ROSI
MESWGQQKEHLISKQRKEATKYREEIDRLTAEKEAIEIENIDWQITVQTLENNRLNEEWKVNRLMEVIRRATRRAYELSNEAEVPDYVWHKWRIQIPTFEPILKTCNRS